MKADLEDLLQAWPMGRELALPPGSTCVVAGAYKGKVVELLHELYRPARIVGFEPQKWAYDLARERCGHIPSVELYQYGIGLEDGVFPMGEWGTDGCSFVHVGSREQGEGAMVEINAEFKRLGLHRVDFMLLNCEGYEYSLLPYMIETGSLDRVELLAVQYHLNLQNYTKTGEEQMFAGMMKTHRPVIDDYPRWILWQHK